MKLESQITNNHSSLIDNQSKRHLYNSRDSSTNPLYFNKQTQSQVRQKQRKLFYDKEIRTSGTIGYSDKQSQTNPI